MAGLKSRYNDFRVNTQPMHLLSPSGLFPLFVVTDAEGVLDVVNGTWSVANVNKLEAQEMLRMTPNGAIDIKAIPPKLRKGETAEPMVFTIRQFASPDAEAFRLDNGIDLTKTAVDPEDAKKTAPDAMERNLLTIASCVAGFTGMVAEDKDNKIIPMPYNTENLIQFMKDYPPILAMVTRTASDAKKFESPR